jgi:glycosyltransferase involved in cell wall biosynthesis
MRLAIDIRTLYTHRARGLGSALMMTLEGLRRDPSDNEYLLLVDPFNYANSTAELIAHYHSGLETVLKDPRFTIRVIPQFAHIFGSYEQTWEQIRLRRGLPLPDQTLFYGYNFLAPLFGRIPFAVHVPDTFVKVLPEQHSLEQKRILAWGGICIREAGMVTTESDNSRRDILKYYRIPINRIAVVHEAVNDCFHPMPKDENESFRRETGLPERFALAVGVIEPRKNLLKAVQALKLYNDRHADPLTLVIVGEAGHIKGRLYTEVTDEILKLDLRARVMILGFVGLPTLTRLYNSASLLLFPSLYEGFGLPPVESMRCGTPVVASNVSALPEITAGAAECVDPHNPEALAKGMERVLHDDIHRMELIRRGFAVAEKYTLEARTRRLLQALEAHYEKLFPVSRSARISA